MGLIVPSMPKPKVLATSAAADYKSPGQGGQGGGKPAGNTGGAGKPSSPKPTSPAPRGPGVVVRGSTPPPNPSGGGHYTWVPGMGWQLIHATGLNKWAPGPPVAKPKAPGFNALNSHYGLNLKDKTKFDVFTMPKTQGDFNREVLAAAQPQYMPQLQDIGGQTSAENAAAKERQGDISSIYNQYNQQAQQAFQETQDALHQMALANSGGDAAAQANLSAALGAAGKGGSDLASMMGMPGASPDAVAPYLSAASGAGAASSNELQGLASGAIGQSSENLANVGNERATQLNTESERHGAALQGLRSQKSAIVEQIPGIMEKAREQLISDIENAQSLKFQQNLATKQFGLSANAQAFNQDLATKQFKETQLNDAANRQSQAATIRQNDAALQNQRDSTNAAAAQALAKAQGAQQVNAIKYLTSWLQPTKSELINHKDSNGDTHTVLADPKHWHRDVGSALRTLMTVYGLNEDSALKVMEAVGGSTFVSGQGGMTVAEWAYTFRNRQADQNAKANAPGGSAGVGSIFTG